jgi:hypothetical protein
MLPMMMMRAACFAGMAAVAAATARTSADKIPNMNGDYVLANDLTWPDKPKNTWPTNFMSYPGGVESFDAYHGPITSTYGQVWWTGMTDDLPKDVVERFDGKVIAMVGFF